MYRKIVGIIICMLFILTAIPQTGFFESVKANPPHVVLSFDSPCKFPSGLAWDGQYLWNADYNDKKFYKIDPSNGNVITSIESPGLDPTGLAWDGQYLWNADLYGPAIYKINPSNGNIVASFDMPGTLPVGLAWDGQYLWNADNTKNKIYKINPSNGSIITSIRSPRLEPTGLAWDGQYLWNADFAKNEIYKIDPSDGSIITKFNSPDEDPWGLAWDGIYLWNADFSNGKIYKINVGGGEEEPNIVIDGITGSFGVSTTITNSGTLITAYDISWSIDVEADFGIILSGENTDGMIDELGVNCSKTIQSKDLRGIGFITITVMAADAVKTASAFLLGPLVLRVVEV